MENQDELLKNEENQIPGEENNVGAETGTAEGGASNEAATVDTPTEENVDNGAIDNNSVAETQEPALEPVKDNE